MLFKYGIAHHTLTLVILLTMMANPVPPISNIHFFFLVFVALACILKFISCEISLCFSFSYCSSYSFSLFSMFILHIFFSIGEYVTGRCSRLFLSRFSLFSSYLFIYMYTYSPILENGYSGILFLYPINEGWCNSCTKNDIYVDRSEAESDTLTHGHN